MCITSWCLKNKLEGVLQCGAGGRHVLLKREFGWLQPSAFQAPQTWAHIDGTFGTGSEPHLYGLHLCQPLPVGLQLSQCLTQLTLKQHHLQNNHRPKTAEQERPKE
jgi:hypothetical protein